MSGDSSVYHWDKDESSWLKEVLSDALIKSMHVIIVNHTPFPKNIALRDSSLDWNSYIDYRAWEKSDQLCMEIEAIQIIQEYIDNGGILICLLTGHEHIDNILTAKEYEGQLMINIASANHSKHDDGNTTEDASSVFYDCFDLCGVDIENGVLKILRIGWNIDSSFRIREKLCYDYINNHILGQ